MSNEYDYSGLYNNTSGSGQPNGQNPQPEQSAPAQNQQPQQSSYPQRRLQRCQHRQHGAHRLFFLQFRQHVRPESPAGFQRLHQQLQRRQWQ